MDHETLVLISLLQYSEIRNQSHSVLSFTPTLEDDGKFLTCRSENPFIAESHIEDKWRLVVHCKRLQITVKEEGNITLNFSSFVVAPVVTLKVGAKLKADEIKEGDDVYFECHIQANPKPYKISWFHNVRGF